jgi:pyruvate dehydrogenase E2 component (dihydrolipoamide acetyltransferase)
MMNSLSRTAQLTYFLDVDVTDAQALRREKSRESDVTIGLVHVLTKACAETLKRFPDMNTVLHDNSIMYFDEINIGIAVALDNGLIVPVIWNVEQKDIPQIARETDELARKAKEGGLSSHEVVGGTFTITLLGTVDGFTPILNAGQSGILGVGRSQQKPVAQRGEVVVREMLSLSLTADHQVIDGAVAASFLRRLQQTIERPAALFG